MADHMPEILAANFRSLQLELRAGHLGSKITDFSGDSSRRFNAWLRDIETMGLAVEATDSTMRSLAVQSVKGQAAEFIGRLFSESPNISWEELKARMTAQFSDEGDREIALQRLRKLKQNKGEAIQSFGERIRRTAIDAYPGQNLQNPIISEVLVNTLIEGVCNDRIAHKLIRSHPESFDSAMGIAIREQQTYRLFELRRKEEDMEVDAVAKSNPSISPTQNEVFEELVARLESLEKNQSWKRPQKPFSQSGAFSKQKPANQIKRDNKWTEDGRPICNFCGITGHKWKECRKRRSQNQATSRSQAKN